MADERHYIIRSTTGFDATTIVDLTAAWIPNPKDQAHQKVRSLHLTAGNIGRFTPQILGRTTRHNSIIRVFSDGPITQGDSYWNVGANTAVDSSGMVQAFPTSVQREAPVPMTTRLSGALPIELGPTDDLVVLMAPGVGAQAGGTIHIIVIDLDEGEIFDWTTQSVVSGGGGGGMGLIETRVVVAPVVLADFSGTLYVSASATDPGDQVSLPPLANIPEGASVTIFRSDPNNWLQVGGFGVDPINGTTDPVLYDDNNFGVRYDRTAVGWSATAVADSSLPVTLADTAAIPVPSQSILYIVWDITAVGRQSLTLPTVADVSPNAEIVVTLRSLPAGGAAAGGFVTVPAGEIIDLVQDNQIGFVRVGDTVRFKRDRALGWRSVTNANILDQNALTVTADPALANVNWRNQRVYVAAYAVAGNFTLPQGANAFPGMRIRVVSTTANVVTLQAGAAAIVTAGTSGAARILAINVPIDLIFVATAAGGLWVAAN